MIYNECPDCHEEHHLRTILCEGRNLKQQCTNCWWHGEPFVPKTKPVLDTKKLYVSAGHTYTSFDCHGISITSSQSYSTQEKAIQALKKELKRGETAPAGPYTAVLWPPTVMVQGKIFT